MRCPYCKSTGHQVIVWFTAAGSQRYLCKQCQRKYVADPKERGYSEKMRSEVMRLYLEGKGFCEISRTLNVNYQTLANWVNTYYAVQLSV